MNGTEAVQPPRRVTGNNKGGKEAGGVDSTDAGVLDSHAGAGRDEDFAKGRRIEM